MTNLVEEADQNNASYAPALMALVQGGAMAQIVCAAAELRIADLLAGGPKHAHELAQATGSHTPSLHRLLRALASLELCRECENGSFALTPMGSLMRTDAANSVRSCIVWIGKYQWPVWGNLLHSVKTGKSARALVTGTNAFGLMERDPDAAACFNEAMVEFTRQTAGSVIEAYDFSGMQRIVDIGGGHGALLTAILQAHRTLDGVVFDLPHALQGAQAEAEEAGLTSRCDFLAGNFFETIPEGADAYLLKNIIHDWSDEECAVILRNCHCAMASSAKLLLIERIMPARLEPTAAHQSIAYTDLAMLVGPGGRERTETEFRILLREAGFTLGRVIPTTRECSILEATPR